jgi:hypothetical protein
LEAVFAAATAGGTFRDGAIQALRAVLGSPHFIYETAFGETAGDAEGGVRLTDSELAAQLAWLVSGAPPDAELIEAAGLGQLRSGSGRERQAQRLLTQDDSRLLYRRFVMEWLGLTRLDSLAKSSTVAPDFSELRKAMRAETEQVIDDVMVTSGGSLALLLAGGYSLPPAELAPFYGIESTAPGERVGLAGFGRVGILQHASFLASFAHEDQSAPVLRGKAVLERLLCRTLPKPSELGLNLMLPVPDPDATTRQRFAVHAERPECASCHDALDGVGFAFENFDAAGRLRTSEAGQVVDTTGHVVIDGVEHALTDSVELARALAESEELADCGARHWVRFAAGSEAAAVEEDFARTMRQRPTAERGTLLGMVLSWVGGSWFSHRSAP